MLSDIPKVNNGRLSEGLDSDDSIKAVISFIRENIGEFAQNNIGEIAMPEKGLNQRLIIFLNRKAEKQPFFFQAEFMEDETDGNSPAVDIGTISNEERISISDREYGENDSFFSIEAKRLPTVGSNRKKEYVIGHNRPCGGIERYKKGIHGASLKYAAIIAYVQKESFDYWLLNINSWIESLKDEDNFWSNDDKIQIGNSVPDILWMELFSKNARRIKGNPSEKISLFHFWVNLLSQQVT